MRIQEFPSALPRRQELIKTLIEDIVDGLAACSLDSELVLFNQATRTFHGLLPELIKCED